jgi:hypothetical protein
VPAMPTDIVASSTSEPTVKSPNASWVASNME